MARVFSFILKEKYKTLHIKQAWAELENSAEKKFALNQHREKERESYIMNDLMC